MDSRKFLVALFVFSALVMGLTLWFQQRQAARQAEQAPDQAATTRPSSQPATAAATAPAVMATKPLAAATKPAAAAQPAATRPAVRWQVSMGRRGAVSIGSLDPASGFLFELRLDARGAAVEEIQLSNYYATVHDKKLAAKHQDDHQAYLDACKKEPEIHKGHYRLLRPETHEGKAEMAFATRGIAVTPAAGDGPTVRRYQKWTHHSTTIDKDGRTQTATFRWTLRRNDVNVLRLTKSYTVRKDDYTIVMTLDAENLTTDLPVELTLDQLGPLGVSREDLRADQRRAAYGRLADDRVQPVLEAMKKLEDYDVGEKRSIGASSDKGPVLWIGCVNKFFGSMIYLVPEDEERREASRQAANYGANFYTSAIRGSNEERAFLTGITVPDISLKPGASRTMTFEIFAGPKRLQVFRDSDDPHFSERYRRLAYLGTVDLAPCFCAWSQLTLFMMWLLQFFSKVGNYGAAIMMLVVLVRIVLHPLTKKSQVSMMKMQKLQPVMAKLREKYKDDKDTLSKETMKMYKEQGAAPILGCLPMLLQMPILIALWSSINATVDLRHAAFLPVWIIDLSAPDRLFKLPFTVPWLGSYFNLLPVLMAVVMYWQMKLNPRMGQAAASPEQEKSQKMMQIMMPILFPLMFYSFPSGLTLYFMTSTFFGVVEQTVIRKHIQAREEMEKVLQTTISMPGKRSRSSRPKKPKGPFWVKRG